MCRAVAATLTEKRPATGDGWQRTQATPETIRGWVANGHAKAGIGILTAALLGAGALLADGATTGGAFDRSFNVDDCPRCGIDQYDAFVAKLNTAGSALTYSTFLGGTDLDDSLGIAIDGARNAYVTGRRYRATSR